MLTGKPNATSNRPRTSSAPVDSIVAAQLEDMRRRAQVMEERGQTDSYFHQRVRELEALAAQISKTEVKDNA